MAVKRTNRKEGVAGSVRKHWRLYVLMLRQDKWYVGITTQSVERRFRQHRGFGGASWTRKYRPIKIHYIEDLGFCTESRALEYEDRVTRRYMKEYGDNNVRGGDLTDMDDYVRRFGYFWTKENWKEVLWISFLIFCYLMFFVDTFIYDFIRIDPLFS